MVNKMVKKEENGKNLCAFTTAWNQKCDCMQRLHVISEICKSQPDGKHTDQSQRWRLNMQHIFFLL